MKRVLIGSPIHQEPKILSYYLSSLQDLNTEGIEVSYCFVDDNRSVESKDLLKAFKQEHSVKILKSYHKDTYIRTEETHIWKEELIWKVADFKNQIIQEALKGKYDYLLFVDSDLVLHPQTLQALIKSKRDIISEVFWTKWDLNSIPLPQVWVKDQYTLFHQKRGERIDQQEAQKRAMNFLKQLRKPGVYEVGGLGALTLISQKALEAGANFKEIKNVSFNGEDRHFCIRAMALGFSLYVDTHYPATHLYRSSDIEKLNKK